jgi:GNAT superfamily N-acetyltransferase
MSGALTITSEHGLSPVARALITALTTELAALYPEDAGLVFSFEEHDVAPGRGVFLVAHAAGEPVGCAAVRTVGEGVGELKRMYVRPEARGRGVARAVLAAAEAQARRLGLRRLVLETGVRQGTALALYRTAGYTDIPVYGEFLGNPLSVCLAKDLT